MVYIFLQFGQCGNQLGEELFSSAYKDIVSSSSPYWNNACNRDVWFNHGQHGEMRARAILVDSEVKVLSNLAQMPKKCYWSFSKSNIVSSFDEGAGNNFALGYSVIGPKIEDGVMEVLRKESERCDKLNGIISLASCSGGTGSGVGTFILENIYKTLPSKNLISVLVSPYISGEVVGQNTNMMFTLSKQNDVCDALFLFENESFLNLSRPSLGNSTFSHLNKVIAQNLLSFLQPFKQSLNIACFDLTSELCPHPDYKFLSMNSFPIMKSNNSKFEAPPSWSTIERDATRWFRSSSDFTNTVASVVITRGQEAPETVLLKLRSSLLRPNWVPANHWLYHHHHPRPLLNSDKSLSVVLNSSKVCDVLDHCISKSWMLFTNNMHVHHYYKQGLTRDDFLSAFYKCEKILKLYSSLS